MRKGFAMVFLVFGFILFVIAFPFAVVGGIGGMILAGILALIGIGLVIKGEKGLKIVKKKRKI